MVSLLLNLFKHQSHESPLARNANIFLKIVNDCYRNEDSWNQVNCKGY